MMEPSEAERDAAERERRATRDVLWLRFRIRFGAGWWRRLKSIFGR